jgi:hypothetical protein
MPAKTGRCFVRVCKIQVRFGSAASAIKSLPAILRRVANPVEPFSFTFLQDHLPLSLHAGFRDASRKVANLHGHVDDGQPDEPQ